MSEARVETEAPSFFDLYCRGAVEADSVHDHIDGWHDRYKDQTDYPPLHEYLGMTRDEYEVWLYDPFSLPRIRQSRQTGESLADIMARRYDQLRAANRREDGTIIFSLGNWLKRQQRH
jgi:hypothetical protein